eukprot:g17942.t1
MSLQDSWACSPWEQQCTEMGSDPRPLVCLETQEEFPSVGAAARAHSVLPQDLFRALRKNWKIRGKTFRYKEEVYGQAEQGAQPTEN